MKKLILITSLVLLFGVGYAGISNAQIMDPETIGLDNEEALNGEHKTLDKVLSEILEKYNVSTIQDLNCEALNNEDFERVGDGVMESMSPGEIHTAMDNMMGGEGSDSLKQAHINMGKNYLGCVSDSVKSFGMMGSGFTMPMMLGSNNNIPFANNDFVSIIWLVNSILITILLILIIKYFWKKGGGEN